MKAQLIINTLLLLSLASGLRTDLHVLHMNHTTDTAYDDNVVVDVFYHVYEFPV